MSNPKYDLDHILVELHEIERCFALICDVIRTFEKLSDDLPAVPLDSFRSLFSEPLHNVHIVSVTLIENMEVMASTMYSLEEKANELRSIVQAEQPVLVMKANGEGVGATSVKAIQCLDQCGKVNEVARAGYQQLLWQRVGVLLRAFKEAPLLPMALRKLKQELEAFESTLSELASVDDLAGLQISLYFCLRECQKLPKLVSQEQICTCTLMLERYQNTIGIATADFRKSSISTTVIRQTIADHRAELARLHTQLAEAQGVVSPIRELLSYSKTQKAPSFATAPELAAERKDTADTIERLREIKIRETGRGIECTQQCIIFCEEALRKAATSEDESFGVIPTSKSCKTEDNTFVIV